MLQHPLHEEKCIIVVHKFHFSLQFILPLWNIFLKKLKCSNDINQLILSFATLGCHSNKEDNVVNTLLKEHEKTIN